MARSSPKKVECPACKRQTVVGFDTLCFKCGANISEVAPKPSKLRGFFIGLIKGLFRLAIFVGILSLLGLMLWPMPTEIGAVGDIELGKKFDTELLLVVDAVHNDIDFKRSYTEEAINGYFAYLIDSGPQELEFLRLTPDLIRTRIRPERVDLVARNRLFTMPITYTVQVKPDIKRGTTKVVVQKAWVGHLPMPGEFGRNYVAGRIKNMFDNMEQAQSAMANVSEMRLHYGRVTVGRWKGN